MTSLLIKSNPVQSTQRFLLASRSENTTRKETFEYLGGAMDSSRRQSQAQQEQDIREMDEAELLDYWMEQWHLSRNLLDRCRQDLRTQYPIMMTGGGGGSLRVAVLVIQEMKRMIPELERSANEARDAYLAI